MSLGRMSGDAVQVYSTSRAKSIIMVAAFAVAIGIFIDPRALGIGLTLIILVVAVELYVRLAISLLTRSAARVSTKVGIEGRDSQVVFVICNSSFIPIAFVEISLEYPEYLRLVKGSRGGITLIPPRGCIEYSVWFAGRAGMHRIGPLRVVVRDPFGLFRSSVFRIDVYAYLKIYPKIQPIDMAGLSIYTRSVGITRSRKPGYGNEFYGVRQYREGDEVRKIHWLRTLKHGKLIIKEMEQETSLHIFYLILASGQMFMGPYYNAPYEHIARIVSSVALYTARRGDFIGGAVVDSEGVRYTRLYRGWEGYRRIQKLVAETLFSPSNKALNIDSDRVLKLVSGILPRERNLVMIFTTSQGVSRDLVINIYRGLVSLRNLAYVIVPIQALYEAIELPKWARLVFRLKASERLESEFKYVKDLRSYGVRTLALDPSNAVSELMRIIASTL